MGDTPDHDQFRDERKWNTEIREFLDTECSQLQSR